MSDAPGWGQPPQGQPGQPGPAGYPPQPPPGQGGWGGQPQQGGWGGPPQGSPPGGYGGPPGGYGGAPGGYGGPPGPGGFGGPPGFGGPGGPPPKKSGKGPLIAVLAVLGILVLGVVGILLLRGGDDQTGVADGPTATPGATATPGTPGTTATPTPFDPPPGSEVAPGTDQSVFELAVGTCFDDPGSAEEIQTISAVPCEQPHDNEVYALVDFPAGDTDPFPGREAITAFGDEQCQGQLFTDYVGIDYANSRYFATTLTPTEGSWGQGDREIVCLLYDTTTQITGSVRGSGQ